VTSGWLLVTSHDPSELIQFDTQDEELGQFQLPNYMSYPRHAVESLSGTFIASHCNKQLKQWQASEVNMKFKKRRK